MAEQGVKVGDQITLGDPATEEQIKATLEARPELTKGAEHTSDNITANGHPVAQSDDRIPPAFEDLSQKQYADRQKHAEENRKDRERYHGKKLADSIHKAEGDAGAGAD
jgi:hypothetical protein